MVRIRKLAGNRSLRYKIIELFELFEGYHYPFFCFFGSVIYDRESGAGTETLIVVNIYK